MFTVDNVLWMQTSIVIDKQSRFADFFHHYIPAIVGHTNGVAYVSQVMLVKEFAHVLISVLASVL
jgi:hypothetical protein